MEEIMTTDERLRRKAAGLVMRSTRSAPRRSQLADLGHISGQPIIVVLDTDTLGEVVGRIIDERPAPPAIVAMYRPAVDSLVIWSVYPNSELSKPDVEPQSADHGSTIGLLFDYMQTAGLGTLHLQLTWAASTMRADKLVDA
jgi:hypothetical protein